MAPIRWHSGEKPLSMKSSVLCLSRSGLLMLTGKAILQGEGQGVRQLPTHPASGSWKPSQRQRGRGETRVRVKS